LEWDRTDTPHPSFQLPCLAITPKVCTSVAPDGTQRISLSYQYLNSSCVVIFALKGEEKRKVYEKLLKGEDIPASKVKGKRKTFIIYST
jgi:6-phosphogluconolactonase